MAPADDLRACHLPVPCSSLWFVKFLGAGMYTIHPNARETILANIPKGSVGAEIGVWRGDFSAQILRTVQPGLLHLIDPWTCATDDEHANAWYGTNAITQEGMDEKHSMVT